jgi:hypothetical protein
MSDFNDIWIYWTDFRKVLRYQISWTSFQLEPSCSMRTDEQTDVTKYTYFRDFANPPKCQYDKMQSP